MQQPMSRQMVSDKAIYSPAVAIGYRGGVAQFVTP